MGNYIKKTNSLYNEFLSGIVQAVKVIELVKPRAQVGINNTKQFTMYFTSSWEKAITPGSLPKIIRLETILKNSRTTQRTLGIFPKM